MKKYSILLFANLLFITSCKKTPAVIKQIEKLSIEKTFSQKIEIAHKKDAFLTKEAIQFDAFVEFGGKEVFNANVTVSTTSDIAKITYKNGDEIFVNKENIFVSPSLKDNEAVRFHAYIWSYFFLYPYKLSDKGTIWDYTFKTKESKNDFDVAKLTFEANIGDAPDDWYIVYSDKKTHLLKDVAYIVTFGKTQEVAEKEPHAIKYQDYKMINEIPFATNWGYYGWSIKTGLSDKIGSAKITNIHFVKGFRKKFSIPESYIKK
ncbi:hypothetical protein [Polaribacter glomeratus]|uniref:Heat-shock protein Hsp90 n=1 Tax=Polaribacter glomeratus TaxID=102 RepID=A0A2S7WWS3_9FLAO|nr:hypothetical protein [Polaribacter glomeratus]PQJ81821.1 hypothetical protein BTO16_04215 [Polaribacter glomeratus]TXD66255.1 hypothetical protein ESX12_05555 [Polaribacter glomeratus]